MTKFWILVGSFNPFVSVLEFNTSPPSLTFLSQSRIGNGPSWITRASGFTNPSVLYATEEVQRGSVHSFTFNHDTASTSLVDTVSTGGAYPTHIGLLRNGTELAVANYGGSSVALTTVGGGTDLGNPASILAFQGRGPQPNQDAPHPHQVVEFGDEVLVPDLGSDRVWRLTKRNGVWRNTSSIISTPGSGPRHLVTVGNNVYTLHENNNIITQHVLTSGVAEAEFVAEASIRPIDTSPTADLDAAEILYADSPVPLLYASNRKDPHANGDAITILNPSPLEPIAYFRTGLNQIRAMEFLGSSKEYIIVGGLQGGGIKVYQRVPSEQGYLLLVAQIQDTRLNNPTVFVPISQEESDDVSIATNPTASSSGQMPINQPVLRVRLVNDTGLVGQLCCVQLLARL